MGSRFKLGSKTTNKDKECVKVHFEISVKQAENVPVTGNVYVQWKRGTKNENKGESKHVPVKDKKAVFEELLEISSTLYKIPKKGYESKNISITLKEEKGKKGTSIAKTVIDLAEFAGKDEKRSFSLKSKKSKVAPTLTLHFKSKEREIAPDEEVTETDGVTEETTSDDEDSVEEFTEDPRDDGSHKSGKSSSSTPSSTPSSKNTAAHNVTTPDMKSKDTKRDSVSLTNTLDLDQLRAELDKAKKRTKELATENVDYEDKIKDLSKELDDLKKSKPGSGPQTSEKETDLRKQIKELTQENSDKEDTIKKMKKEQEETTHVNSVAGSEKEAQMKKRLKELATENVDLEEQVNSLKKELEEVRAQGGKRATDRDDGLQKQVQEHKERIKEKDSIIISQKLELEKLEALNNILKEKDSTILLLKQDIQNIQKNSNTDIVDKDELRKKVKELARANEDTEEELELVKKQVEQLKKSASASNGAQSEDTKRLQLELSEKDNKISGLEHEIDILHRKSASDSPSIMEYKDKIAEYKEKMRSQQEENEKKLNSARSVEIELNSRIQELEESNENARSQNSGRGNDRDKYEREIEKEKESRKKAEKEAIKLREKLDQLESTQDSMKRDGSNGREEPRKDQVKDIMEAVYSHIGQYSSSDGVSESALALWGVLHDTQAYLEDTQDHIHTNDVIMHVLKTACDCMQSDMSMLFYWLSTSCALLHMIRDEPNYTSNNDRDPIIDGVYQPVKEPPATSGLQERLEWLSYCVYKQLVTVISNKLTPVLAPVIIEKPLTDKKTQVKTSAVMRILDRVLARTRHHYLYDAIVQQLFVQLFYFVSCHLANTILQKNKLTPSIGFQIKLGLSHLEDWISQPSEAERALLAPCSAQLDAIRDVGGVLVLDKSLLADVSTLQSIFRVLNLRQIKRLLEVFEPDQLAQGGLPPHVREAVSTTWNSPHATSQPLLLEHNKMLPFSPQFE